ncbi:MULTISPECIES: phage tail tape measure protein [unclassified Moraxella]|uniref:phage tail tape measure protein n=1 Tax=unclassified Moraxella TaxID=2685852 RepID=UPI00359D2B3F
MSVLFLNVNIKGNDQLSNALDKMNNAAKKLNDGIKDTQKHLASLSKMQLKVSSFEKLKQETSDAQKKLESYKKTAEALKQQLAAGGKNPELTNQLKTIEKEAKKLQGTVDKNTPALKKMRQELNNAGLSGMSMADAQRKLKEDIEATTTAISKQQTQLEKFNKAQDHYDKMKGISNKAAGVAGWTSKALITGGSALAIPVKIAIDAEKSMADVAKVVDGLKVDGKVTQEYHQFEAQLTQMSNRLGKSFGDLAAIMAGGAQGGIAKTELLAFTEAATKISIAWDMTASDVGQALAELRSTLKMSQSEVQGLADQINYLGNNSTNNAKYILEVVQYSGSVGAAAGVAGEQIAAMAASLSGIDASSASTGIKNIIKSLTKGKSATKSQQKAWQELGTTAEQMAVEMLKDPQKAIENYLQMLGKLPEEQRLAFAAMISGDEALPVLSQMMNDPTKFSQYAADIKDKNKVGGSVDEEYNSATSTTAHQLERAKVKLQNFGKDFGKYLLPVVGKIADGFSAILDRVSAWMIANPQLAKYLAMAAVGVMAILAGVTVVAGAWHYWLCHLLG